jgi:hypothetical protein
MYNITTSNELKAIAEVNTMNTCAANALAQFQSSTRHAYDAFWFGQTSPIDKIKLLGTDALRVFTDSAHAQAFLASKINGYIPLGVPQGYQVSFNEDGSGVITQG